MNLAGYYLLLKKRFPKHIVKEENFKNPIQRDLFIYDKYL